MSLEEIDAELLDPGTEPKLSVAQLFVNIWGRPKKVFTALSKYPELKTSIVLLVLSALLSGSERMQNFWYLVYQPVTLQLMMPFFTGASIYLCTAIGMIFLLKLTGGWMGGEASISAQTSAYGFATLPTALFLVLIMPNFFVYQRMQEPSTVNQVVNSSFFYTIFLIIKFLKIGLSVWTFVLHIIGVAIVQKFTYFKAFLSFILAAALIFVPLLLLGYAHII